MLKVEVEWIKSDCHWATHYRLKSKNETLAEITHRNSEKIWAEDASNYELPTESISSRTKEGARVFFDTVEEGKQYWEKQLGVIGEIEQVEKRDYVIKAMARDLLINNECPALFAKTAELGAIGCDNDGGGECSKNRTDCLLNYYFNEANLTKAGQGG
jgi:hypothetical protein